MYVYFLFLCISLYNFNFYLTCPKNVRRLRTICKKCFNFVLISLFEIGNVWPLSILSNCKYTHYRGHALWRQILLVRPAMHILCDRLPAFFYCSNYNLMCINHLYGNRDLLECHFTHVFHALRRVLSCKRILNFTTILNTS